MSGKSPRLTHKQNEELRWLHYRSVPKADWSVLSGRSPKVINARAVKHDLPNGKTVDLQAFLRAVYTRLDDMPTVQIIPDDDILLASAGDSQALEDFRAARARLAELDLAERKLQLIPRDELHDLLAQMANLLRCGGEQMEKQFGADSLDLYNELLDGVEAMVSQYFDDSTPPNGTKKP